MSCSHPFYQAIFEDLYRQPPKKGFLVKALETLEQQQPQPLLALTYFFNVLELDYNLVGETNSILKFRYEPLSWGLYITGPTPLNKHSLYLHTQTAPNLKSKRGVETVEFKMQGREDLAAVARSVIEYYDVLTDQRCAVLRPAPWKDGALLHALRDGKEKTLYHPRFEEAERAVMRSCLLDACVDLFMPFGLQPRIVDEKNKTKRVEFKSKHLRDGIEPIIWIDRLDHHFDLSHLDDAAEEEVVAPSEPPLQVQPKAFKTSVVVQGLRGTQEADALRALYAVLHAANLDSLLEQYPGDDYFDLQEGLVYDLASQADRIALVERVLRMRDEMRIEDDEAQSRHVWHGKMKDWGGKDWRAGLRLDERRKKCRDRESQLRYEITPEEMTARDEEREKKKVWEAGLPVADLEDIGGVILNSGMSEHRSIEEYVDSLFKEAGVDAEVGAFP
ncbi:uncharacterized protein K460DRAFT_178217 [Cucurbitaria berberidis CBS 394.84]|uniref:Uncharacterized protein n=1 Tax=Cucurbitaria berberidis CBS 394.84 TaxID=1168544 RepID=A0A9P4GB75_9PLEO|nr:uncharacterized protein K460DRAFT_178217 [Cucurbitaria berberidis CBS 394.84]KAF1842064.1 hypothetical protein K460DRAFT_178217 [Cucurbitaria berberidis CBS 394.84]